MLLAAIGGWWVLTGEPGAQWLRGKALATINTSLAGRVEARKLRLSGGLDLVLEDVKLFTPEGELVAEVARVTATPSVWALPGGKVVLSNAKVEKPRLYLKTDERGLNLNRALADKVAVPGAPTKVDLTVKELTLTDGYVDWIDGEKRYTLDAIHLEGRAMVKLPQVEINGSLHLGGKLIAPLEDTLTLDLVSRTLKAGDVVLEVNAATTDSHLQGFLSPVTLKADIKELFLTPRLVRALAPGFKLLVPISARGSASPNTMDLTLSAGTGRVTVKGNLHEGALVDEAQLDAEGIDLAELLEGGRRSILEAHLKGRLNDARIGTLDGTIAGEAKWSEAGKLLAEVQIDAKAVKGAVDLSVLKAKVPGAEASVSGSGDSSAVALTGTVEATDLRAVVDTIGELTLTTPPQLTGAGKLAIAVRGPLLHPGLSVEGTFKAFGVEALQISGLHVDAQLADIRRPLEAKGTLKAKRLLLGQTGFQDLVAEVTTEGRHLIASLSTQRTKALALRLRLDGMLDHGEEGVLLSEVTLEYPPERWLLDKPSHLSWKGGDFELDAFSMTSRDAHLSLELGVHRNQVELTAQLQGFDLKFVPPVLVPGALKLSGHVDAKVHAFGKTSRVEADAELGWSDGAIKGLTGIGLSVKAHAGSDHLTGSLTLGTAAGSAVGTFEVPLGGKKKPGPLAVHLTAQAVGLTRIAAALDAQLPVEGEVDLTLDVVGTLEDPLPTLHAESANLGWCRGPCPLGPEAAPPLVFDRVVFNATADDPQHATGTVAVTGLGGLTTVSAKLPRTFRQLLDLDWSRAPLELTIEANGLDLVAVGAAAGFSTPVGGRLQVKATTVGPLSHPQLLLQGSVAGFQYGDLQPADLSTTVKSTRTETLVDLEVSHAGKKLLVSHARLGGPLETLWHQDGLAQASVQIDGDLGPLQLADVWQSSPDLHEVTPTGTLRAQVSVKGTASAPRGSMRGTFEQLVVGKVALGQANLEWDYAAGRHVFSTSISSIGSLKGHGELTLDVSLPALIRGLDVAQAPVQASLKADKFDLAFLSGIHPMLRNLGGKLKLDADFKGVVSDPGFQGSLEWTDGRLGLAGFGEYKEIHLLLTGGDHGYLLSDLSAHSAGGELKAKGEAKRASPGVFALTAEAKLDHFPIVTDDQLLAIATTTFELEGEASRTLINIKRLTIPSAHIELPEVKRKNLQDLQRPADIVLTRNGVPVVKKKKKPGTAAQPSRTVRVLIDAPTSIFVKSSDVNLELGLSDKFRVEFTDQVRMYGEVLVLHGRLDVIGRRFDIQRDSQVRFAGAVTQPYVNVTAVHTNALEGVTVFVTVVGHGTDYVLKTSSQPPLPDTEIFTLLTTGRRNLKLGGSSSISAGDAVSVLGSLAASQLKTLMQKKLPIDVLSVESGKDGIQTARVEAGTYLSDKIYLGYLLQLGADRRRGENVNAGKIEYQLSKSWSLDATAGDAPAAGAELVWSHEY